MSSRLAPVDGLRAISTASLVALHCTIIVSGLLPARGEAWTAFCSHPLYGLLSGGGCQVDVFLLLSGFLLALKHTAADGGSPSPPLTLGGVAVGALRRACRLWPVLLFVAFLQQVVLGEAHAGVWPVAQVLGFVNNYFDVRAYGTFTLTVAWSVCVDFQAGVLLTLLLAVLRGAFKGKDGAYRGAAKACLAALFVGSFVVRALLQHPTRYSIIRLGEHTHFSDALTASSHDWIEENYGYTMPVSERNAAAVGDASINRYATYTHDYLNRLYLPTHARYGPMALGALLAFLLPPGSIGSGTAPSSAAKAAPVAWWKHVMRGWALLSAAGVLCMALMPPPAPGQADAVPAEAHAFMTTALRNMFAAATAVFLYSALVPAGYGAHSKWLRGFLSWRGFAPIARLSYAINMVHFRVLMELAYRPPRPLLALLASATSSSSLLPSLPSPYDGFAAVGALYVVGMAASAAIAWVFCNACEDPIRKLLETLFMLRPGGVGVKKNKKA